MSSVTARAVQGAHYPDGETVKKLFSSKNYDEVFYRFNKKQISFSTMGDVLAPTYRYRFMSGEWEDNWRESFRHGNHIIVPKARRLLHTTLIEDDRVIAAALLILMAFAGDEGPIGSNLKGPVSDLVVEFLQKHGVVFIRQSNGDINWDQVHVNGKGIVGLEQLRGDLGFVSQEAIINGRSTPKNNNGNGQAESADKAQISLGRKAPGGINFNADKLDLQVQNQEGEIKFKLDPAMLRDFQNAPGFVPVIIKIQPLNDIGVFFG